ncbi:YcgN family cysteine cluster protein [Methylomarinum sp. Ch1-1]|uniref:UPF0260 protein Q9L42_012145 n=1 Tax=Methylomarinum roseum TaxID=3067653 RepID=A0AAU7NQ83_9GAMM|nr:YcgN family cysteine cluster protein [Methylomarinum sp. Ch1-1]MDP4520948.1 YcgN family cysteine cluster protein [Methylomarinum sp. Ch1-1]
MNFWESKTLAEMTTEEWESLCDNCGKCCLNKLEDEETGDIYFTSVVCDLIDLDTCRCTRYAERCTLVPECLDLKQHDFSEYTWLPSTCAYRLLTDGKTLPDWHPLVSGTPDSVKEAGVAIGSYAMKESDVEDLEDHIIEWLDEPSTR